MYEKLPCGIDSPLPDMEYSEPSKTGELSGSPVDLDHSQYLERNPSQLGAFE